MSGNQSGLLYNWLFDEADGNIVEDHVRSRNGIIYFYVRQQNENH